MRGAQCVRMCNRGTNCNPQRCLTGITGTGGIIWEVEKDVTLCSDTERVSLILSHFMCDIHTNTIVSLTKLLWQTTSVTFLLHQIYTYYLHANHQHSFHHHKTRHMNEILSLSSCQSASATAQLSEQKVHENASILDFYPRPTSHRLTYA